VLRRVLTLQHFPIITDVDAYAQVSVLLLKTAKIKFKKLTSLQQGVRAILIATNRKQQKSIWGESSCVKFQNRPYKASHSEYLQNVVFLIYICLPELCLINIRRRTQFVFWLTCSPHSLSFSRVPKQRHTHSTHVRNVIHKSYMHKIFNW